MTIWDHMRKGRGRASSPLSIGRDPQGRLLFAWDDGGRTGATARELRVECPCAGCVDEHTGERTLDPTTVPETVGIRDMGQVGNYGLKIVFDDGHDTGIFDWGLLRRITRAQP